MARVLAVAVLCIGQLEIMRLVTTTRLAFSWRDEFLGEEGIGVWAYAGLIESGEPWPGHEELLSRNDSDAQGAIPSDIDVSAVGPKHTAEQTRLQSKAIG